MMKRLAILWVLLGLPQVARAQTQPPAPSRLPLDRVEILGRLGVGYPPSYIAKLVKTHGVNFAPTPDFVYRVRLAGGAGILVERLSSAEPATTPNSSAAARSIDHLAKCAELVHAEEESAKLECQTAIDENRTSAWPLLIMARVMLDNGMVPEDPEPTDEDRAKHAAFMDIETRAAALAPNASPLSTVPFMVAREGPPPQQQPDAEDLNELQGRNGWSSNNWARAQFPGPVDFGPLETFEDEQPISQELDPALIERLQEEPELASSHLDLASLYEQIHDFEKATSECRQAEALEPDNVSVRIAAGVALLRQHKSDEAVTEMREAVRIAPSGVKENAALAGVYELGGRTPEAIAQLQGAIGLRPTNAFLSEMLVGEFVRHKNRKAAIAELRRSLAADYAKKQDDAALVAARQWDESALGQLLIQEKRFPEATAQYRYLIQVQPDNPNWHNDYGNFLFLTHKCDEALDEYHQTLRLSPELSMVYSNMAMCSMEKKDYEGGIDQLKHALEATPDDPAAENNLAWLYCTAENPKFRNPSEALRLSQHAVQMQPDNAAFLDTLAAAQLLNGNAGQALETETKALAIDPENQEFQMRILELREAAARASTPRP